MKHHAKVIVGYPFKSKDYTETGIRIVGGYNLMQGYVVWSECKYWERIDGYEKYLLEADDIVMAMDRPWVNGGFKISKIDGRELFIPPHELQMEFAYFIKQVDKSKLAIQQSLDELETLKKSLMQQYFG